jgi:hypothetical protein
MHGGEAAEGRVILEGDMTCERCIVDEDDMIADLAVMRDMGAGEEKTIIANACDMATAFGAAIHGHMLADRVMRANDKPALLAAIFLILGRAAQHREGMDFAALSDLGPPGYDGMRVDLDTIAKRHLRSYDGERANLDASPELRIPINRG